MTDWRTGGQTDEQTYSHYYGWLFSAVHTYTGKRLWIMKRSLPHCTSQHRTIKVCSQKQSKKTSKLNLKNHGCLVVGFNNDRLFSPLFYFNNQMGFLKISRFFFYYITLLFFMFSLFPDSMCDVHPVIGLRHIQLKVIHYLSD